MNAELKKESEMLAEAVARLTEGDDCILANLERENAELKKEAKFQICNLCRRINPQHANCNYCDDTKIFDVTQPKEVETK